MMSIGVVLNTYRRRNIGLQLEALRRQTIQPDDILVWRNDNWTDDDFQQMAGNVFTCSSNRNLGVWSRFTAGLFLTTDILAVFDDDTIPGSKWLENCLNCFNQRPGVYGTFGVTFKNGSDYRSNIVSGWRRPSAESVHVDWVGHGWFFPSWLAAKLRYVQGRHLRAGEDMGLSFIAQKHGFDTFTAPHPKNDIEMWGSVNGLKLGHDSFAISKQRNAWNNFQDELDRFRSLGWRLLCDG